MNIFEKMKYISVNITGVPNEVLEERMNCTMTKFKHRDTDEWVKFVTKIDFAEDDCSQIELVLVDGMLFKYLVELSKDIHRPVKDIPERALSYFNMQNFINDIYNCIKEFASEYEDV